MSVPKCDTAFEAYSYGVSARSGSRAQIVAGNDTVTSTGARLSPAACRFWITVQAVLLTL